MASTKEINVAVAAMKKATVGLIHNLIVQKVPGMFESEAEEVVNSIEEQLLPKAASASIDAVDAFRKGK